MGIMSKNLRYDNIIPLFSGSKNDHRVRLFAHALNEVAESTNNGDLSKGFNNDDKNNNPSNFQDIMLTNHYYNKPVNSVDNDIHHEFTQFIIDMAKYHSNLDPYTGQRFNIQEFRNCNLYDNFFNDEMMGGNQEIGSSSYADISLNPPSQADLQRFSQFERENPTFKRGSEIYYKPNNSSNQFYSGRVGNQYLSGNNDKSKIYVELFPDEDKDGKEDYPGSKRYINNQDIKSNKYIDLVISPDEYDSLNETKINIISKQDEIQTQVQNLQNQGTQNVNQIQNMEENKELNLFSKQALENISQLKINKQEYDQISKDTNFNTNVKNFMEKLIKSFNKKAIMQEIRNLFDLIKKLVEKFPFLRSYQTTFDKK